MRLVNVQVAAAEELPTEAWFEASQRAGQGNVSDVAAPPMMRRRRKSNLGTIALVGAGVALGGALLIRALRDRK